MMKTLNKAKYILVLSVMATVVLAGCQPKQSEPKEQTEQQVTTHQTTASIPLVQAKVVAVNLKNAKVCVDDGCTQYSFQTVQTNQAWIDDYFLSRIKKAEPNAFMEASDQQLQTSTDTALSESRIEVRFLGQNYNLASFVIKSYVYSAGVAHGMYHQEFVNFDLTDQKHITVDDLVPSNKTQEVQDALYAANQNWLQTHHVEQSQFKLSDNYYYGVNGIVFVYPLYELASYAEGMSELTLPYEVAQQLLNVKYLPQ